MAENAAKQPSIAASGARRVGTRRVDVQGMGGPMAAMQTLASVRGNHAVSGLLGSGTALPPQVLAEMESRFGQSFSDVRVHNDSQAHASAAGLQAKAYTHGPHIVFGAHRFSPHAGEGKQLMAHELAHVVQQRRGGPAPALSSEAPHEASAHRAATTLMQGDGAVAVEGGSAVGVARDAEEGGARGALMERAKSTLVDKLLNGVGMPPAGSRLGAAVARGMGEQIVRELMSKDKGGGGKGALLLGRIAAMGSGDVAQLAKGYLIGLGEGIVSPVTDLFGLAVFAEHMQNVQRDLLLSVLKSRWDLTSEWQSLVNEAGLVKHSLGSVWQRMKDDPAGSLATLLSLPDAIGELAERKAYELGKQGGSSIVASLETPWAKKEEAPAPDLLDTPFAWVESKAKGAEDWALAAPWAQMGSKVGYAVGFVAVQVILFAFTEGIGNAIEEVGVALGKVGNALGRLSKAIGTVAGRVAELVAMVGKGIAVVEEAIALLIGKAFKPLAKLLEPVLTPLGNALKSLRAFLRKLFGVVEKEGVQLVDAAAGKVGTLADDATKVAPKVASPPGKPPEVHGPTAKPKPGVGALGDEAKVGSSAGEEARAASGPKGRTKNAASAAADADGAGKTAATGKKNGTSAADDARVSGTGKKAAPKAADRAPPKGRGEAGKPAAKGSSGTSDTASGLEAQANAGAKPKKRATNAPAPKAKPKPKATEPAEPKPEPKPKAARSTEPKKARAKKTDVAKKSLDERIVDAEQDLAASRKKTNDYFDERAQAGRSRRGGPKKGIDNAKERIWMLKRQKAYPKRQILENCEIKGMRGPDGKFRPTKKIAGVGREPDFIEIDEGRAMMGELKSEWEFDKSLTGGPGTPQGGKTSVADSSKMSGQFKVEDKVLAAARKGKGKVVVTGYDLRTGKSVELEFDPDSIGRGIFSSTSGWGSGSEWTN